MSTNVHYMACWTEDDGIYCCGHEHRSIAESMNCLVPDGRSFIRARESGASRSLNDGEAGEFLVALQAMPWRSLERSEFPLDNLVKHSPET